MSQASCSGRTFTLPLLVKPGQLVILGTLAYYGAMDRAEVVRVLGRLPASRAISSLERSGWVRVCDGVLSFAGTENQLAAIRALAGFGYTPLLAARDRLRSSGVDVPFPVRVFGSFAARLCGQRGKLPADIDLLIPCEDESSPPNDVISVLEDYVPSGQLELHCTVRQMSSLHDPESFWGAQMESRPWIAIDDLPGGRRMDVDLAGNAAADPSVLFASAGQMRVVEQLLRSPQVNVSQLSAQAQVNRSRVMEILAGLSSWVTVTDAHAAKLVSFSAPQVVRDALNALLPMRDERAAALLAAGADQVWAFGQFANWLATGAGEDSPAQLLVVNSQNWSVLDVARVLYPVDPDAEAVPCDLEQFASRSDKHIAAAMSGRLVRLA